MRVGKDLAVTQHAIERIYQRIGLTGSEVAAVVRGAWRSKQIIPDEFLRSKFNLRNYGFTTYQYRKYQNKIFVFQKKYIDSVLITVYLLDRDYLERNICEQFRKK